MQALFQRPVDPGERDGALARLALRFTAWTERWVPDAFIFALLATLVVFALGLTVAGAAPGELVQAWGRGFWDKDLLVFMVQMVLVIVTGYVLASSRPVLRAIAWLAGKPRTARGATAMVALFAMLTSWLNWGFSLIFSTMLVRQVARRRPEADYRALAAAAFLGLGSIWAQGLSGSAALQMATAGALPQAIRDIVAGGGAIPDGIITFRDTIFLWQSLLSVAVEVIVVTAVVWLCTPAPGRAVSAAQLGVAAAEPPGEEPLRARAPGEWLEHSPILTLLIVGLGAAYLVQHFAAADDPVRAINLNTINLSFLLLGFLLHWTPARLMRAVREAVPATWGVLLQFPFYFGIAGMITHTHLNARIADFFVSVSSRVTFAPLIALYSALLGVFVPSGGSKWVIEAPYVMAAAHAQHVHLGWVVAVYDLGEALANLVQPFWMLPTLALLGLRARDVMGFTFIVFIALLPVVLILVTVLAQTLPYPL